MSSNERHPSHSPEEAATERPHVKKITPEALRENEKEAEIQRKNVEVLIAKEVEARSDWSDELREYMAKYLREHEGQWRECDGDYIKFTGFYPNFERRIIEAVFDAYGMDMADDIPMPEWMQVSKE